MKKTSFLLLFFACGLTSLCQQKLSIIYESYNADTLRKTKHLLAIQGGVSFNTTLEKDNIDTIRLLGTGFNSHDTYIDVSRNLALSQSQPHGQRKYLVYDTVTKLNWQPADGEKEILGYRCKKAAAQEGKTVWVAWYATSLPFSFGPYMATSLPGLILELTNVSWHRTYAAIKIAKSSPPIVEPSKGKRISSEEFQAVLVKMRN